LKSPKLRRKVGLFYLTTFNGAMETETLTFNKYSLKPKFFFLGEVLDEMSNVFPSEVIDPHQDIRDLFFRFNPRCPGILHWHTWAKPTRLTFPYFDWLNPECLDINLGPMKDDNRIQDKWVMLSGGNADDDDELIYAKESDDPEPLPLPELPVDAAMSNGMYEFRYILSIE
tara:strand:- start:54 stop:566 length:513 start_codon:yes stop_codon:yes gene_type:complete